MLNRFRRDIVIIWAYISWRWAAAFIHKTRQTHQFNFDIFWILLFQFLFLIQYIFFHFLSHFIAFLLYLHSTFLYLFFFLLFLLSLFIFSLFLFKLLLLNLDKNKLSLFFFQFLFHLDFRLKIRLFLICVWHCLLWVIVTRLSLCLYLLLGNTCLLLFRNFRYIITLRSLHQLILSSIKDILFVEDSMGKLMFKFFIWKIWLDAIRYERHL